MNKIINIVVFSLLIASSMLFAEDSSRGDIFSDEEFVQDLEVAEENPDKAWGLFREKYEDDKLFEIYKICFLENPQRFYGYIRPNEYFCAKGLKYELRDLMVSVAVEYPTTANRAIWFFDDNKSLNVDTKALGLEILDKWAEQGKEFLIDNSYLYKVQFALYVSSEKYYNLFESYYEDWVADASEDAKEVFDQYREDAKAVLGVSIFGDIELRRPIDSVLRSIKMSPDLYKELSDEEVRGVKEQIRESLKEIECDPQIALLFKAIEIAVQKNESLSALLIPVDPESGSAGAAKTKGTTNGMLLADDPYLPINVKSIEMELDVNEGFTIDNRATLIHEWSHILMNELYNNNYNPYPKDGSEQKDAFKKVFGDTGSRMREWNTRYRRFIALYYESPVEDCYHYFKDVKELYDENEYDAEGIVRYPEMLTNPHCKDDTVRYVYEPLAGYWSEYIVPDLISYIERYEGREIGDYLGNCNIEESQHEEL